MLEQSIREIPYWRSRMDGVGGNRHLRVDKDRIEEIAEG